MSTENGQSRSKKSLFKVSALMAQHSVLALALCAMLFALCSPTDAQQPTKIVRIGYLGANSLSINLDRPEAFRQGLRELGYIEGKNIVIEWRSAEGKQDRLPALAAELVRLNVDIIITGGPPSTRAAKKATVTIPIVMGFDNDPVGNGFVASLARPGGNITGLATLAPGISGKLLELLKEVVPRLSRVAVLGTSTQPGNTQSLRETELAARAFGVKVQLLDILGPKDIETAFRAAGKGHADGVLILGGFLLNSHRKQVTELAVKSGLPAIYISPEYVEVGGAYELRRELYGLVPARCYVCRQDSKRCKACRPSSRAADQV